MRTRLPLVRLATNNSSTTARTHNQGFPGYGAGNPQAGTGVERDSFSALMDLSLTKYITLRLVRVLFILGLIGVAVQWVFSLFATFALPDGQ